MEHTKKNILTFRSKHTIKSLLFTSFLAGMLGCTSSNKAEFEDSDLQGLSSAITKLTEEKAKTDVELSKTAQEKTKLEHANNQTAKELEAVNKDLKKTNTEIDNLNHEKDQAQKKEKRLKEEKEAKKLQKKKDKEQNKKTALTTAENKFDKCKEKLRELAGEKDKLLVHIKQCKGKITEHETEKEKTSGSLEKCKQKLIENSNRAKSLQRQLLLVAKDKDLKLENIHERIGEEMKTISGLEEKLIDLRLKGKNTKKKETELKKHKITLDDLIKIKESSEEESSKRLIEPIEAEVKNCKVDRTTLKKDKKDFEKKLNEIKAAKEKIETQILNGQKRLEDIGHEITKAVKKKGKLGEKVETLQNKS